VLIEWEIQKTFRGRGKIFDGRANPERIIKPRDVPL
jgi:hypothetical protein